MRKITVRDLVLAAMAAALYAVMGYFGNVFGLTFGPVQIRFAEALTVLPFLFPAAAPGLAIGCLITNLLSPYGPMDIIFGTLATAVAAGLTMKMPKWYLAALPPILVNALILPRSPGGGERRVLDGLRLQRRDVYPWRGPGLLCSGHAAAQGAGPGGVSAARHAPCGPGPLGLK